MLNLLRVGMTRTAALESYSRHIGRFGTAAFRVHHQDHHLARHGGPAPGRDGHLRVGLDEGGLVSIDTALDFGLRPATDDDHVVPAAAKRRKKS